MGACAVACTRGMPQAEKSAAAKNPLVAYALQLQRQSETKRGQARGKE